MGLLLVFCLINDVECCDVQSCPSAINFAIWHSTSSGKFARMKGKGRKNEDLCRPEQRAPALVHVCKQLVSASSDYS